MMGMMGWIQGRAHEVQVPQLTTALWWGLFVIWCMCLTSRQRFEKNYLLQAWICWSSYFYSSHRLQLPILSPQWHNRGYVKCPNTIIISQRYSALKQGGQATGSRGQEDHKFLINGLLFFMAGFCSAFLVMWTSCWMKNLSECFDVGLLQTPYSLAYWPKNNCIHNTSELMVNFVWNQ